jgi:hypothetical protein
MHRGIPTTRRAPAAAALLAALLAAPALAQPSRPTTPQYSMLTVSLLYTAEKSVLDELKLSDEQAKKFTEYRKKWFADYGAVIPPERAAKGEEMSKANDKALADLLKPEQLKRLRELTFQAVEKQYGGAALRYPEVAAELKLSDEQKTKARTQNASAVLTKDQLAKWEAMKGDAFKGPLAPDFTVLSGRGGGPGRRFVQAPQVAVLLARPSIQQELALSDEQRTKVQGFRDEWGKVGAAPFGAGMSEEQYQKANETAKEIARAAEEMLKPAQQKRLKQIEVQQQLRYQPEEAVFSLRVVVADLKLSEDQQKKIADLRQEREQGLAAIYLLDEDADAIAKKAEAYRKETHALLTKVLDAGQQEALTEVVGKPFAGLTGGRGAFGGGFPGGFGGGGRGNFGTSFGLPAPVKTPLIILGLPFVEDPALHKELKLSDDQAKQLAERARKHREAVAALVPPLAAPDEQTQNKLGALFAETEKAVGDILSAAQLKRFKELAIQQMTGRGTGPFGAQPIAQYAEIVEGLKVTELQREQLFDGEPAEKVLSKEQQDKWTAMKGEPFKGVLTRSGGRGRGGFPGGGGGRFGLPTIASLLGQASVQEELQLSDEQRQKTKDLPAKWQEATKDIVIALGGGFDDDLRKKLDEANKVFEKAVADILKPAQERRLREIELQQEEKGGMQMLLRSAGLRVKLSLTEDQQKKMAAIGDNSDKVLRQLYQERSLTPVGRPGSGLLNETVTKLNKATDDKVAAVLTADQTAKLKEMLGKPFTGELLPLFGGGFPGGGGFGGPFAGFEPPM